MNIVYIANSRFPSEKAQSDQVMAMCQALAAQGQRLTLLVPRRSPIVDDDPFAYYRQPRSFAVERLWCLDALRWRWLGRVGLWLQTLTFILTLRKRLKKLQPDIVYSRDVYTLIAAEAGGKRIWEAHSAHRSSWARWLMRRLDGVVTLTEASAAALRLAGVDERRILVEPDAVDPDLFVDLPPRIKARQRWQLPDDEFVCLYVGKFTTMGQAKGLDEAIAACRRLRQQGTQVTLLAVGGTPEELLRCRDDVRDGIRLLGHQPQRELKWFYAAADAVVMTFPWTEHYAHFMSPLKLFEYLASGIPIIASDLPSIREIISEDHAYLVPAANPSVGQAARESTIQAIQAVILSMIADPASAKRKAGRAQQLSKKYTWQARAKRIIEFVNNM